MMTTTPDHAADLAGTAYWLAARGWHVFPCVPGGKQPAVPNGLIEATTCFDTIEEWWRRIPAANVGVNCGASGLVVIDSDVCKKTGEAVGEKGWEHLVTAHGGDLSEAALTVATPSGGVHRYYRHPATDVAIRSTQSTLAPGVDVRARGGYVVVPPSRTGAGDYRVTCPMCVPPMPTWLAKVLIAHAREKEDQETRRASTPVAPVVVTDLTNKRLGAWLQKAVAGETEKVRHAPSGQRNHILFCASIAVGQLVGAGLLTDQDAFALLMHAASVHVGVDGFTTVEAHKAITSGLTRGVKEPRQLPTYLTQKAS